MGHCRSSRAPETRTSGARLCSVLRANGGVIWHRASAHNREPLLSAREPAASVTEAWTGSVIRSVSRCCPRDVVRLEPFHARSARPCRAIIRYASGRAFWDMRQAESDDRPTRTDIPCIDNRVPAYRSRKGETCRTMFPKKSLTIGCGNSACVQRAASSCGRSECRWQPHQ